MQRACDTVLSLSTKPRYARRQAHPAFSIVDLTLTVLILGIVAATAVPRLFGAVQFYQVDGAARQIEADLNYVRSYARFSNANCTLTFTTTPAAYTTTGVPHLNNSGQAYAVTLADAGYPVSLSANLNGSQSITFTTEGVPLAGSPVQTALTSGTITLTNGTFTRTVTIDPSTGKARRS